MNCAGAIHQQGKTQMGYMDNTGSRAGRCVTLAELGPGETGVVNRIDGEAALKRRLNALGMVKGIEISLEHTAPMGDPRAYTLMGYQLSLRNEDARKIVLQDVPRDDK